MHKIVLYLSLGSKLDEECVLKTSDLPGIGQEFTNVIKPLIKAYEATNDLNATFLINRQVFVKWDIKSEEKILCETWANFI